MNTLKKIVMTAFKSILLFVFLIAMSCEERTPDTDGYYTIDGKRYNVYIMDIDGADSPQASGNNILVTLQGAPAYNVSMFVTVPQNTLSVGTYYVSDGYEPNGINWISFLRGNTSEDLVSDADSEGNMTVNISGKKYMMWFTGKVKGHDVEIHYTGLVSEH